MSLETVMLATRMRRSPSNPKARPTFIGRDLIGLLFSLVAASASAQTYLSPDPPPTSIDDRFRLEFDVFYGSYDTQVRLNDVLTTDPNTGRVLTFDPGTALSLEDDFGLPDSQFLGQVELTLLPGRHHLIRLNGLSMRRQASQILRRNVAWEDADYLRNERLDSYLNLTMAGLTYGYLPIRNDRFELGASFGIQIAAANANAEVRSRSIRDEKSGVGPLALFGAELRYEFTKRWSVDARVQYISASMLKTFGAKTEDIDGSVMDGRLAVRFRQNQHFVYGLGYKTFNIEVQSRKSSTHGDIEIAIAGPVLFIQASL